MVRIWIEFESQQSKGIVPCSENDLLKAGGCKPGNAILMWAEHIYRLWLDRRSKSGMYINYKIAVEQKNIT